MLANCIARARFGSLGHDFPISFPCEGRDIYQSSIAAAYANKLIAIRKSDQPRSLTQEHRNAVDVPRNQAHE
jgi:hypothetical protein